MKIIFQFFCIILFCLGYVNAKPLQIISINKAKKEGAIYHKGRGAFPLRFEIFPLASSQSSTWPRPVIPATFVLTIPNGRVYSNYGYAILNNKYLIDPLLWPWSPIKKKKQIIDSNHLKNLKKIKGKALLLTQEGHNNYYHWITEIIPKLELVKDMEFD
jgi:hypothetical protein